MCVSDCVRFDLDQEKVNKGKDSGASKEKNGDRERKIREISEREENDMRPKIRSNTRRRKKKKKK